MADFSHESDQKEMYSIHNEDKGNAKADAIKISITTQYLKCSSRMREGHYRYHWHDQPPFVHNIITNMRKGTIYSCHVPTAFGIPVEVPAGGTGCMRIASTIAM